MRQWTLALAALTPVALALAGLSSANATSPMIGGGDYPYWKLDYSRYDTTYAAVDAQARHYASFRWDSAVYCRYRTGWQGPGAYHVGDRFKVRQGWDGAYPWQGPGVAEDHGGDQDLAVSQANYARIYGQAPVCEAVRHPRRRRHEIVLRRKG